MSSIMELGFVFVGSMDKVVDLQEESVLEGILIDYVEVLVVDNGKAFKVFQLGGDE